MSDNPSVTQEDIERRKEQLTREIPLERTLPRPLGRPPLEEELRKLLNMRSQEKQSNTPDHILASYLIACLDAFNIATVNRDRHWRQQPR